MKWFSPFLTDEKLNWDRNPGFLNIKFPLSPYAAWRPPITSNGLR